MPCSPATRSAVVFDLDGTLVDSEPLHERAARDTLLEFGIDPPAGAFDEFIGQRVGELTAQLAERYGVPADALLAGRDRRFAALLDRDLTLMPGAADCLDRLRREGAVLALATSATSSYLSFVQHRFGWDTTFATVVCGDDVTVGKPDPETYLLAADRLGAPAASCLVVEDSPRGCAAGAAAGMRVVAVDHARRPPAAYPGARWIVPDLGAAADLLSAESSPATGEARR